MSRNMKYILIGLAVVFISAILDSVLDETVGMGRHDWSIYGFGCICGAVNYAWVGPWSWLP